MFISEKEMQDWLSDKLQKDISLGDLLSNIEEFEDFTPSNLSERKMFESFNHCLKSLYINEVISGNKNISLNPKDSLRPDFLLYSPEAESNLIVELKNFSGASRQAGTEISAYASEVKSYVPFISDGDIINVIISPVWPALLRHYVFHEIFWVQRNIICLEPTTNCDREVGLKIKDIPSLIEDDATFKIGYEHLGGYQLCLYDYNLYSDPNNRSRIDPHIEQMKTAINAMATKGNSQKSHGFAFLWKDNWELSLAPYSITVINFAPFQSVERLFHDENFMPNEITEKFVDIITDFAPEGHGESLNAITDSGIKFIENFCSPRHEGFTKWDNLKDTMLRKCDLISFHPWGVFEELYSDKLLNEYQNGNLTISSDNPELGLRMLNEVIDPNYEFINLAFLNYDPDEDE